VKEPLWLSKAFILAVHDRLLAEHGGSSGIRDDGLLGSALAKPKNLFAYAKPTLFDLAASYAVGIVKNHLFVDGNKRTGFVAAATFLDLNRVELTASESDATVRTLGLAAGEITEEGYSAWLKTNSKRVKKP
jgi:death on curing protein